MARLSLLSYDDSINEAASLAGGDFVGAFGEKFREERERRGFTLDDVSNVTKINLRMLQAIEDERFELLPGGVFSRGFVRTYAKLLGFTEEEAIAGYQAALGQAQPDAQRAAGKRSVPAGTASAPVAQALASKGVAESEANLGTRETPSGLPKTSGNALAASHTQSPTPQEAPDPRPAFQKSSARESSIPTALVQPPHTHIPQAQPSPPPPLWISPPPSSTGSPVTSPIRPPSHPVASASPSSSSLIPETSASRDPQPTAEKSQSAPPASSHANLVLREESAPAQERGAAVPWKIPVLILALAAIIVAALLAGRHSRRVGTSSVAPAQANSQVSPQPGVTTAAPLSHAADLSGPAVASASTQEQGANSTAERAPAAAATLAPHTAASKAKTPPPFQVAILATKNCWISVTADGQLVSRENLIAPASTSVKASREIVVQVSDAAGISFRWNDRQIPVQAAEAEAKTFIFDNSGLRTSPPDTTNPNR